jgi:cellobiose phosphorylase
LKLDWRNHSAYEVRVVGAREVNGRRIESPAGLVIDVNANGSIRRIEHGDTVLNLFPGSEVEGGPANLYLRRLGARPAWTPLLGPRSPLAFHLDEHGLRAAGSWEGVRVVLTLRLGGPAPAWFWHVALASRVATETTLDVVYAQDVALAPYAAIRTNEYYVSQYLDHTPLAHPARGVVVAVRQNLPVAGRHPWLVLGSLACGASFATDALQFHGLATRAGGAPAGIAAPSLPGVRRQHEHAMVVIQDTPVHLAPGATAARGFFAWFEPHHPAATSVADLAAVDRALALPEASAPRDDDEPSGAPAAATLFSSRPVLRCRDLTDAEIVQLWGERLRHVEREDDQVLSFFTGVDTHVALRAKELRALRPHGHILRTGAGLEPDEASLTTTVWMAGVFNALLTQGHVGMNRLLSTTRSYLGLQRAHGQRIFVELAGGYHLLDVPSAWEITPNACRWLYAHAGGLIEVRVSAATDRHAVDLAIAVVAGPPTRFLVSSHVALNGDDGGEPVPVRFARDAVGVVVRPVAGSDLGRRFPDGAFRLDPHPGTVLDQLGGDELLFADGGSRDQPYVVMVTARAAAAGLGITGHLVPASPGSPAPPGGERNAPSLVLQAAPESPLAADVARLQDIVPWYVHDALIHYLAPRGLEQYSGGAWGTRDVCQGPVELLLALGLGEPVRDLLLRVFANQSPDGDWPQWFMFFARERAIRPADSHGDIVFWPLLALAQYLLAEEDASILDAAVPFFHPGGDERAERATVWQHAVRALAVIGRRVIPGTQLAAYGNGDWDDSLQPADPLMRERLCSAWTVTLHYQTLITLAAALGRVARAAEAEPLERLALRVRDDFARWLLPDATLAGFAYFHPDGRVDYLLHPRDQASGIHYRLLPMIHAIVADLLTPEQAAAHVALVRDHLLGADGARLFDRPHAYRGGPQRYFQRAESSTFFGREIGLMYTHAHLRYAEAMARLGDAGAFFEALRRANPIALRAVVPAALPRQSNCYYSSSDAVVADRYEAAARYAEVRAGRVPLEGGWRIYSSGPGIAVRVIHQCLLGLRRGRSMLGVDPVIPKTLDGLRAEVALAGRMVRVRYRIAAAGHGPTALVLNGHALPMTRAVNPYRTAGVTVPMAAVRQRLVQGANELVIDLG